MASEIDINSADAINKIDKAVDDLLKRLKNIENPNLITKHYQLDLFRIYSELYYLKSLLNTRWYFWNSQIENYKLNTDNITLKAYAQFDNKIEDLSCILNIKIDENIDYNKEYAEIIDIKKYYDCISYILNDLKKNLYLSTKSDDLDKLKNIISEPSYMKIYQHLSFNLPINKLNKIFAEISSIIRKHKNKEKFNEKEIIGKIIDIAAPLSLNPKINNSTLLSDTQKKYCDALCQNHRITNKEIATKYISSENSVKDAFKKIYKDLNIIGQTKENKRKNLIAYFEQ